MGLIEGMDKLTQRVIERAKLAQRVIERAPRTAAADKVPVFSKFEVILKAAQIEKMVAKHYDVEPGSCKISPGIKTNSRGAYVNFTFKSKENKTGGSVVTQIENEGDEVRLYAWVNIDG